MKKVRTPGGRLVMHETRKRHGDAVCAICGGILLGVRTGSKVEIGKLSRSERRPERPFGGVLCSACTRNIISMRARMRFKEITKDDVPISLRKYVI